MRVPKPSHLRNAIVAALSVLIVLILATQRTPAGAQVQVEITPEIRQITLAAGSSTAVTFTITNRSGQDRSFTLTANNVPSGFTIAFPSSSISVPVNSTQQFSVVVTAGANTAPGIYPLAQITATAQNVSGIAGTGFIEMTVSGATFTPTPTGTTAPSVTTSPTLTTTPGPVCRDRFEPDDGPGQAKEIQVNRPQPEDANKPQDGHAICPAGDEDWLFFGGVSGKVYTIDVPTMATGLDLTLTLYDEAGRQLAFADDYYNRAPGTPDPRAPGAPAPNDIRPRIQSWRAQDNGRYYIRVRDAAGGGGTNDRFYTIQLLAESYGPTPTQLDQLCQDIFEPDGLPEQARQINPNEVQLTHILCPVGDADWVRFFGKSGKTYFIFTDTRPYTSVNPRPGGGPVNNPAEAGADTVLYLVDRDGVSPLDINDDIPGGSSLDSQLEFTPSVDGFYYAQVKNVGDLGNQFIRYDLTLQLCIPGQTDCGRPNAPPEAPTLPPDAATPAPTDSFIPDEPTSTPTVGVARSAPDVQAAARAAGFADVAFQRVWQRNDQPVAARRTERSWMWGPGGYASLPEPYDRSANGARTVQYFDKGRMEMNTAESDRSAQSLVTSGLLVRELIEGRIQVGANIFADAAPAQVVIAGDADDPAAPTYASLHGLIGAPERKLTGEEARSTLTRDGSVGVYSGPSRPEMVLVAYVPETGHNIPAVFADYLSAQGLVYENGTYRQGRLIDQSLVLGFPISEPYWVRVKVGGAPRDVLMQAFERRILTYSPDNVPRWQVEMGNVGRHYYQWRYGRQLQ
jgi:hypothetical protein